MWTGPNTPLALADTVEESSSGELGGVSLTGFYSNATGDRGRSSQQCLAVGGQVVDAGLWEVAGQAARLFVALPGNCAATARTGHHNKARNPHLPRPPPTGALLTTIPISFIANTISSCPPRRFPRRFVVRPSSLSIPSPTRPPRALPPQVSPSAAYLGG